MVEQYNVNTYLAQVCFITWFFLPELVLEELSKLGLQLGVGGAAADASRGHRPSFHRQMELMKE